MNYEFKNFKVYDAPLVDVPTLGKTTLSVICISGVVGDTYNFERIDNFNFVCDNSKTLNQTLIEIRERCIEFVSDTYPNT
jgi:hypothetical protein